MTKDERVLKDFRQALDYQQARQKGWVDPEKLELSTLARWVLLWAVKQSLDNDDDLRPFFDDEPGEPTLYSAMQSLDNGEVEFPGLRFMDFDAVVEELATLRNWISGETEILYLVTSRDQFDYMTGALTIDVLLESRLDQSSAA